MSIPKTKDEIHFAMRVWSILSIQFSCTVFILPLFRVFFASVCFSRYPMYAKPTKYVVPYNTVLSCQLHTVCVLMYTQPRLWTLQVFANISILLPPSLLYSMQPLPWAVGILNWLCNYQMVKTSTSGSPSTVSPSVVLFCMRKTFANEPINRNVGNLQSNFCDQARIIMYAGSGLLFLRSH